MSVYHNINGVYRETWSAHTNVNGVWRDIDQYVNVNGVWRQTYKHSIEESDIIGFRMIYKRLEHINHPDHPNLLVNNNLPIKMDLTGDTYGFMDKNQKGVVFQYDRTDYDQEGICVYKGDLYAVLINDELINIGLTKSLVIPDTRIPGIIPGIDEVWSTNKLEHLKIEIDAYILYESNGYHMSGWNSLFSKKQFTDPTDFPDTLDYKKIYRMNSYNILPIDSRNELFDSSAYIGIARDMSSDTSNMVGSYGVIDHTICEIRVNDIAKPFVFEIYD